MTASAQTCQTKAAEIKFLRASLACFLAFTHNLASMKTGSDGLMQAAAELSAKRRGRDPGLSDPRTGDKALTENVIPVRDY